MNVGAVHTPSVYVACSDRLKAEGRGGGFRVEDAVQRHFDLRVCGVGEPVWQFCVDDVGYRDDPGDGRVDFGVVSFDEVLRSVLVAHSLRGIEPLAKRRGGENVAAVGSFDEEARACDRRIGAKCVRCLVSDVEDLACGVEVRLVGVRNDRAHDAERQYREQHSNEDQPCMTVDPAEGRYVFVSSISNASLRSLSVLASCRRPARS